MIEKPEHIAADADGWCEKHDVPKLLEKVQGDTYECPKCDRWYLLEIRVEEVPANV